MTGSISLDNVDVGGVLPGPKWDAWYLLGVMNSTALDFVWRNTAKFFRGGYHSANKQFIAPLPIPKAKGTKRVAALAKKLAGLHEKEAALRRGVGRRLAVDLAPDSLIPTPPELASLPRKLGSMEKLSTKQLLGELERFAKKKFTLAERARWDEFLTAETGKLAPILRDIEDAHAQLNERVFQLFDLTTDDIRHINDEIAVL